MTTRPQTIQIHLPHGKPSGIRMAEITTRTVRVFDVPRSMLNEFLEMHESSQVGVYYLMGIGGGKAECYIGQTGNVGKRLKQHAASKEFWSRALVAVSLTNSWTSTHVSYMEHRSIAAATEAGKYDLHNLDTASNPHTLAPLQADCDEYLETISVLLTTLGHPVLEKTNERMLHVVPEQSSKAGQLAGTAEEAPAVIESSSPVVPVGSEVLTFTGSSCHAKGYATKDGGIVVLAGSTGRATASESTKPGTLKRRAALIESGSAEVQGDDLVLLADCHFGSVSSAASILAGTPINGRTAWKTSEGLTYSEAEEKAS